MNPRAATNDLLPFQGSPFNHLGTSALVDSHLAFCKIDIQFCTRNSSLWLRSTVSGESGIRTHAPLRTNGFQDRLVMTTSISLLKRALLCYQKLSFLSRTFFKKLNKLYKTRAGTYRLCFVIIKSYLFWNYSSCILAKHSLQ